MYDLCLKELKELIPKEQYKEILNQQDCELDGEFLGFITQYKALSMIIPKEYTVIDFGCYAAAQCYFFREHKGYIGVDCDKLKRFEILNTKHFYISVHNFINNIVNKKENTLFSVDLRRYFAICNYLPDNIAENLVKKYFRNCFVFYPANFKIKE